MDNQKIIGLLKDLPIFQNFPSNDLKLIAQVLTEKTFSPGETFIEQGDKPDSAYIIVEGSAKAFRMTEQGEEINLNIMGKEFSISDQVAGINWSEVEATRAALADAPGSFIGFNDQRLTGLVPHSH